jgi:hypothetical protein
MRPRFPDGIRGLETPTLIKDQHRSSRGGWFWLTDTRVPLMNAIGPVMAAGVACVPRGRPAATSKLIVISTVATSFSPGRLRVRANTS